ncbi:Quinolinate phosphoribosyltransferase [decarboxylating] [hydrothermal vent metagenome]|uniref:Probable nicotinate-nucleotide pyrophosphorylase [carboxylating] n=1 Tax=hydrothermal vent metagenome TaxID=652676 RepID=A0A3B0Z7G2_9ZZZZ
MAILTLPSDIKKTVKAALKEDIGKGDITASLIPPQTIATATVITRETAVLCGREWFTETMLQLSDGISISWQVQDGDRVNENQTLCTIQGPARAILSAERVALNFLQLLSGIATESRRYADRVKGLKTAIRDTRKTIPGLRLAQKYAVRCGGCENHRIGLYDGVLIKENHILACGSITRAVEQIRASHPKMQIEVEVENLEEFHEALAAKADMLLLDNFDRAMLQRAVILNKGQAKLEASGGVTFNEIRGLAESGIDYIAIGTLTKNIQSIDLSMRFTTNT